MSKNKDIDTFYLETADGLVRWDQFHVLNENLMHKYEDASEDKSETKPVIEACDLYVLHIAECDTNPGNKILYCLADPKDSEVPFGVLATYMSIHPKEPMYVKKRKSYYQGTLDVIHMLDKKRKLVKTDAEKDALDDLIAKVGRIIEAEKSDEE